jgi:hypothetical protein
MDVVSAEASVACTSKTLDLSAEMDADDGKNAMGLLAEASTL